jgi:membrane fusion protein, multidrug efflux system
MTSQAPQSPPSLRSTRHKRLMVLAVLLIVTAGGWGAWMALYDPNIRVTDDAYVGGHIIQVTPEIAGAVIRIYADNTDHIEVGALLVELDSADAKIELAISEAQFAQSVRNVRSLLANNAHLDAEVQLRQAELARAEGDFKIREELVHSAAVSREVFRHAGDALRAARAALASAENMRAQALAQTDGATVDTNPMVQLAAERVRAAALSLARTRIYAPAPGMVAQRKVQLGRRVAPGEILMTIVPFDEFWVDANFKEVQLAGICPGQSAKVTTDIYGRSVVYHAHVAGVEAGTGSAFALLPPQNATGNWIKVVQRAPVRILLNPAELARNPLRIGMSAGVEVDASACKLPTAQPVAFTEDASSFYSAHARSAVNMVAKLIAENTEARP